MASGPHQRDHVPADAFASFGLTGVAAASALTRVWITRPLQEAALWVQQLQAHGFNAHALPLIEIAPVSDTQHLQALARAWQQLSGYTACMFVSANAVEHFFKQKSAKAPNFVEHIAIKKIANAMQLDVMSHLRFMAPGPGTVAALRAAGVDADKIDAPAVDAPQFDSQALWGVIGKRNWHGCRVLLVRGLSPGAAGQAAAPGRDWITRQWQDAGASVEAISVYQRCAPVWSASLAQCLSTASAEPSIWVFSSSEAVENLVGMVKQAELAGRLPGGMDWHCSTALATHPRIAATARAHGWGKVLECRPALAEVAAALASITAI